MIRSIAKFLVQYFYDSTSPTSKADRLPRWLRRWIDSDPQLQDFERDLLTFERKLTSQSENHVANGLQSRKWSSDIVQSTPKSSREFTGAVFRSPVALAALAAGLVGVLFVGRWLVSQPTVDSPDPKIAISRVQGDAKQLVESKMREEWIQSTLSATKRLASKWNQKSNVATSTLAFANQKMQVEGALVKLAGIEGLRFVGQKLPAATVRMLGMNDDGQSN